MYEYFKASSKLPSNWFSELFEYIDISMNNMVEYVDIDYDSFDQKQLLIYRFNALPEYPTIFTEAVEIIKIGNEVILFPVSTITFNNQFFENVNKLI